MTEPEKPKIKELADEVAFWNAYREVYRSKEIDIAQVYAQLAAEQERRLTSPGAREDFAELCKAGCHPIALAALVAILRYFPLLERFWTEMVGRPDNREKATRTLEKAAKTFENIFRDAIALEDQGLRAEFTKMGRLPISSLVSELRFYIKFINLAERMATDIGSHSLGEVCKYVLASYVKRMTGQFHDRSVSALIGETCGSPNYNEVAQRMWRARNYKRMEKHLSWMPDFLVAMSVVIAHSA